MTIQRSKSTEPVNIEGWSWQPFLEDAVKSLEGLNFDPYPVPDQFLPVSYTHLTLPTICSV